MTNARALTIAGSDPGGGAGIQQDLKTFQALGCWGMSAITAVTVQSTLGVTAFHEVPAGVVEGQIRAVLEDIGVDAVKTGMLATAAIVKAVARALRERRVGSLVVDPVLASSHGEPLLSAGGVEVLAAEILPLALVVTPNSGEAERLTGVRVADRDGQREAARALVALGARAALVTGGHVEGPEAVDVLWDGSDFHEIVGPRLDTPNTHGSGCMLSAAIAAGLAEGGSLLESVRRAKGFVAGAIEHALSIGKGAGPVDASWRLGGGPWPLAAHPFE
ncbi:MAG: bifunctional hydroxymethylpyrimidine kinase/phosphomethylpyrimidine kinase [Acidobacteria bacterium]|nr:bifunctional hydroxymethylpyrimidine kinase/phosphomethylpyrimidine kinase [Acidobacteriota bacterium]